MFPLYPDEFYSDKNPMLNLKRYRYPFSDKFYAYLIVIFLIFLLYLVVINLKEKKWAKAIGIAIPLVFISWLKLTPTSSMAATKPSALQIIADKDPSWNNRYEHNS